VRDFEDDGKLPVQDQSKNISPGHHLKKKDRGFNSGRAEPQRKSSSSQGISPTGGGSSQTRLSFERISYRLKGRCLHRKSIDRKSSCVIKIDWIKRL
jgi:hypothetical protein